MARTINSPCRIRSVPWDRLDGDDNGFVERVRDLVELRRRSAALRFGSMRWLDATADSVTFVREHPDEIVIVHLVRAACDDVDVSHRDLGIPSTDREPITLSGSPGATVITVADPAATDRR